MVKQLHTSKRLLIALYLRQPHYQTLFIIYQEFTKKNANACIEGK